MEETCPCSSQQFPSSLCTFKSPNKPSGGPGIWERLLAKGSGCWGRVGTTTLQANFSAAVVSVCRWEGLRGKVVSFSGKVIRNAGWLYRKGGYLRTPLPPSYALEGRGRGRKHKAEVLTWCIFCEGTSVFCLDGGHQAPRLILRGQKWSPTLGLSQEKGMAHHS